MSTKVKTPNGWKTVADCGAGASYSYSTNEQWTGGYWIDGKKIYRKVFTGSYVSCAGSWTAISWANTTSLNIDKLLKSRVLGKDSASIYPKVTDSKMQGINTSGLFCVAPQQNNYYVDTVIIEYTKTTD